MLFVSRLLGCEWNFVGQNARKRRRIGKFRNGDLFNVDRERLQHAELQIEICCAADCADYAGDFVSTGDNREFLHVAKLDFTCRIGCKAISNAVIVARRRRIIGFQFDVPCFTIGFRRLDAILAVPDLAGSGDCVALKLYAEQIGCVLLSGCISRRRKDRLHFVVLLRLLYITDLHLHDFQRNLRHRLLIGQARGRRRRTAKQKGCDQKSREKQSCLFHSIIPPWHAAK